MGALLGVLFVATLGALSSAGCDGDVDTSTGGGGAGGAGPGSGGGGAGGNHVCASDAECGGQAHCDFADDLCGAALEGTCSDSPGGCSTGTGPYALVCGCDGSFHGTDCIAFDGTDRSVDAAACGAPPAGVTPCGSLFCQQEYFYCQLTPSGTAGPDTGACITRDDTCTTCACITPQCAGGTCTDTDGAIIVTCPPAG